MARIGHIVLGGILVVSAMLKINSPIPMWFSAIFPHPHGLWLLAVFVELIFGLILVSGIGFDRFTSFLAIFFFAVLGTVAIGLTVADESSCGCFGRVPLKPHFAAVFDVSAVVFLFLTRPARGELRTNVSRSLLVVAIPAVIVALLTVVVVQQWREPIYLHNVNAGPANAGSWKDFSIRLENRAPSPVKIVGYASPRHVRITSIIPTSLSPESETLINGRLF